MQIHKVIRSKFLKSWSDQVFLCPFVVRIECCWIAKFDYQWDADQGIHHLRSCSVCPPIPGKDRQPAGVLCKDLDDMLKYHTASEAVSLTDLLLMSGSTSPPPGFHMLVQYVATLCHLHSVPLAQPQLRRYDQQILDISQAYPCAWAQVAGGAAWRGECCLMYNLVKAEVCYVSAAGHICTRKLFIFFYKCLCAAAPSMVAP